MDTLFRLVNHQSDQSFNSRRTSSSLQSSKHYPYHNHHQEEEEECFNIYMDEDDFSSSSKQYPDPLYNQHQQQASNTPTPSTTTNSNTTNTSNHPYESPPQVSFSPAREISLDFASSFSGFSDKWASDILLETGRAIADKNSARLQQLMWTLNELGSPYGDTDQKLAAYFLRALFSRMSDSGSRSYKTLSSASEKTCSFDSTRKMVLKFQEVSPWTTFGHVACNGAIMEAVENESKIHIVDISNTYCTQWPTLLEALATRTDETPHLRITTVVLAGKLVGAPTEEVAGVQRVMQEIGSRMEKFARLMGVPFKFNIIYHASDLSEFDSSLLDIQENEALVINCVNSLHTANTVNNRRDIVISMFRRLQPKIVTVVEEEADLDVGVDGFEFFKGFQECVRWFRVYLESLDESFPKTSHERLVLERQAGAAIMDLVACPPDKSVEQRESATRWSRRLHGGGFSPVPFSDEVCDDVRALLRRYKECWSMVQSSDFAGIFLSWRDQSVVWASAWRP